MNTFTRVWKKFLITAKHLVQRMIIRLRKLRKYKIPKRVDTAIKKIYKDCCILYTYSADSSLWENGVQEIIKRNQMEYSLLFEVDTDYPESEYVDVDTKEVNIDLISANKQLEIAEKRLLISDKKRAAVSPESDWFYSQAFISFQKRLFTLELQVLTKYFSFGKIQGNNELIELGEPVEATLLA